MSHSVQRLGTILVGILAAQRNSRIRALDEDGACITDTTTLPRPTERTPVRPADAQPSAAL